jgi:lipopolysaccharide export system protein LptC
MSEPVPAPLAAAPQLPARLAWALPHSSHDRLIGRLRKLLPAGIAILGGLMIFAPILVQSDLSFVLSKDRVEVAKERLRIAAATYRGEDSNGRAFELRASSAVQATSRDPIVKLSGLTAKMALNQTTGHITANRGRYDMDAERVTIDGPMHYRSDDGYRLDTSDVNISLRDRRITSVGPVNGNISIGDFAADHLNVNLPTRVVVLEGRARLHIVQGAK